MIDRINLILRAKNITARQFAEEIGIQPSGMSHILGGRNNPSLDFVAKVLRRYPEIDANWLLLGRGGMYSDAPAAPAPAPEPRPEPAPTLFPSVEEEQEPSPKAAEAQYVPSYMAVPPVESGDVDDGERTLEHILFIYSDKTFSEYRPATR